MRSFLAPITLFSSIKVDLSPPFYEPRGFPTFLPFSCLPPGPTPGIRRGTRNAVNREAPLSIPLYSSRMALLTHTHALIKLFYLLEESVGFSRKKMLVSSCLPFHPSSMLPEFFLRTFPRFDNSLFHRRVPKSSLYGLFLSFRKIHSPTVRLSGIVHTPFFFRDTQPHSILRTHSQITIQFFRVTFSPIFGVTTRGVDVSFMLRSLPTPSSTASLLAVFEKVCPSLSSLEFDLFNTSSFFLRGSQWCCLRNKQPSYSFQAV